MRPAIGASFLLAIPFFAFGTNAVVQPRTLDDFSSVERWEADPSPGVEMEISRGEGRTGAALRVDFDFGGGGGYAISRLPVDIDLPENYELSFLIRGETPVNTLEVKFLDESRENVWWSVKRRYRFPTDWTRLRYKKRHLDFAWGPQGGGEIKKLSAIEIVVVAAEGGKGTIWVDDLTFTPLEPERPYDLTPSLSASSTLSPNAPVYALDGSEATAWRSGRGGEQHIEIDFLRRREIGGLIIDWAEGSFASDYDVVLSVDDSSRDTVWRTRGGDGGRDWIVLPEAEASYVRLVFLRGPGAGYGIREIDVLEPQASETKSAMWERIAAESPAGSFPKYLSGRQSYWTVIGAAGDRGEALINEEGTIDIDPIRFSLDPFLRVKGDNEALLTWTDAKTITQSLAGGDLPIPTVVRDHGDLELSITAFARGEAGHSVLWVRYRVANSSRTQKDVTLHLAIRPLQVNPSWQFLAMPGGTTDIVSLQRKGARIVVNDTTSVIAVTRLDSFGAMRFSEGEIVDRLHSNAIPETPAVEDPLASASGVMSWSFAIPPGSARDAVVAVPFHERPAGFDGGLSMASAAAAAERELEVARADWENRLGRVGIHLPEVASHVGRAIRSNLAYILINRDGPSIQPGSRSYDRSWIRDGSLTSAALLRLAHPEEVKDFIEWYALHQRDDGYVPCCVGERGADPVPENDSHGQFIYLIREYYDFTGDRALLERMWPHVLGAVEYMDELRHQRMTDEYREEEKRAFFGLMPESISHEGYSAKPMHSFWDDFFALKGFEDAARIAAALGEEEKREEIAAIRDEFRRDLHASIDRTMAMHGIDYIPGSVELGDFDATSTTIAINPGDELRRLPEDALEYTFDRYWREIVARRDGEVEWEAYTPYEWRTVGTFIRTGQPERAKALIDWFFTHSRPPAWNHWAEVVFRDETTPKFIGDMPHTWVGSDFIRSILDMFAWERDDALVIGAALPLDWVTSENGVAIDMLRTRYGPLSWTLKREGAEIVAEIGEGVEMPAGGIVVVSPIDRSETIVREVPARVSLGRLNEGVRR